MKGQIICPHCQKPFNIDKNEITKRVNLQEGIELGTKPEEDYYLVKCPACNKWVRIKRKA
jgi:endogenous inhibitor of DNA gyrase (YacG/DUF329 family)